MVRSRRAVETRPIFRRNPDLEELGLGDLEAVAGIDLEVRAVLDRAQQATLAILTDRRAVLEEITRLLLERESIDAAELQAILDRFPYTHRPAVKNVDTLSLTA